MAAKALVLPGDHSALLTQANRPGAETEADDCQREVTVAFYR